VGACALALALGGTATASGCSESYPKELVAPEAGAAPDASGLDERPVSPGCLAAARPTSRAKIGFELVTPVTFTKPVTVAEQGGRLYVLEQGGQIRLVEPGATQAPVVADLASRIVSGGEAGLLGIAFHPKFAQNKQVFLYYTAPHPTVPTPAGVVFQSVVARYESPDGGRTLDLSTEKRILVVDQPFANHNGGTIAFGSDGFLYLGLGDGGGGGDPLNAGQDEDQLLGKMLRIDVDGGDPYSIPPTNPFAGGGGRPEIYALGFRNPYRFSFDRPTGDLWVGDVGQGEREEIDKVVLGGNYGWRIREGKTCYNAPTCDTTGLIDPVVDYTHAVGLSVTGGVVYRGTKLPALAGKYVYADILSGVFWAIPTNVASPEPERLDEDAVRVMPSGFALDATGEIVFTEYGKGGLHRVVAAIPPVGAPAKLSETGCVDPKDPKKPAAGLFPYDVNVGQWVDGATSDRFLSVPAGAQLEVLADGRLVLPPGSIAMRTLAAEGRPRETQLLMRRPDATWSAYTYAWRGDDAELVTTGAELPLPSGRVHHVAPAARCTECHDGARETATLGLEAAQLDRDFAFSATRTGNLLATLERLAMLTKVVPRDSYAALPALESYDTIERRARAYLHANCASCHRGAGPRPGSAAFDLRFSIALGATGLCDAARVVPGNPQGSLVPLTMRATDAARMPPLATRVVHDAAVTVVEDWVRSLRACN